MELLSYRENKISEDFKPAVFWSFNDILKNEELTAQLDALLNAGCTGGFMHSRVGLVTEYMSPEWMDAVRHCCEEARKRNTHLWLYDEDRFPSGYAGGAVLARNDALRTKALCLIPAGEEGNYRILTIYKRMKDQDKEYILALCAAGDGNPNFEGKCYVDLLDPETTQVFLEETHEKYRQTVGEFFGKELKGSFSDEFCYVQKAAFRCATVPFTTGLEMEFAERYGYDLVQHMELLFFDGPGYPKIRRDFYELVTNRFIRSFTIPYDRWCRDHSLIFTGHLLHEDFLTTQAECTGAVMPHYVHMQMPGIDILGSEPDKLMTVKQVTSVAEQFGRRCLCEAFGCSGHQFGPGEIKRMADWLCVLGIDFINPHLTLYSARGERKRDYPPDFSWRQPWFEAARDAFDHISRVCQTLHSGIPQTDVLVIHPIQSVWAEFSPLHKPNPVYSIWAPKNVNAGQNFIVETECFQKPFMDLSEQLSSAGISFHYGDEMIMEEYGKFDDGIVIGRCCYRQVIVPPVSILKESTIALLTRLAQTYGKNAVIFVGDIPSQIPLQMRECFTVVTDVRSALRMMGSQLNRDIEVRDVVSGQHANKILWRCKYDEQGRRTIYLVNTDRSRAYDVSVSLANATSLTIWDTVTGAYFRVPGHTTDKGFACRMHLKVGGSAMLFEQDVADLPEAVVLQSGVSFSMKMENCQTTVMPKVCLKNANILPLNVVRFAADGRNLQNRPVESLWQTHFYKLPNGTPFEAEYRFQVDQVPESPVTVLIEMARNLDEVLLNGEKVALRQGHNLAYFDSCYDSFETMQLRRGMNSILIRGKKCNNINGTGSHARVPMGTKHPATELESVFVCGDFGVVPVGGGCYTITNRAERVCGSVSKGQYPFYLGNIRCNIRIPAQTTRIRVDARGHAVKLRIGDVDYGTSYLPPFEFAIPAGKEAVAEVTLYGSMENTFGPLHLTGRNQMSMMGPAYFTDMKRYSVEPILLDFGIWSVTMGCDSEE